MAGQCVRPPPPTVGAALKEGVSAAGSIFKNSPMAQNGPVQRGLGAMAPGLAVLGIVPRVCVLSGGSAGAVGRADTSPPPSPP